MKKYLDRLMEIATSGEKLTPELEKEVRLCTRRMTSKEKRYFHIAMMDQQHPDFCKKLVGDRNFRAKVIAAYVRSNIEDFHVKYLNDSQMKELNPLIRNAIFTAITQIEEGWWFDVYAMAMFNLPSYWEDCQFMNSQSEEHEQRM